MKCEFTAQLPLSHEGSGVGAETEGMLFKSMFGSKHLWIQNSLFICLPLPVPAKLHIRIQGGQKKPTIEKS
jgi:hypothetical protein